MKTMFIYRLYDKWHLLFLSLYACGFIEPEDEYLVTRKFIHTKRILQNNK